MDYPYGYPYVSAYDSTYDPYGTLRLTNPQPDAVLPFAMPLSVDEVKAFLRLDVDDNSDNDQLQGMIYGAVDQAEILQNRDLFQKQWDLSYDYWLEYRMRLRAPCVSVDLVQYTDLTGHDTPMAKDADYLVDLRKEPAIITPPWNHSWPAFTPLPSSAILVRFTSGFAADDAFWKLGGARVKMGMLQLISAWHEERVPFTPGARNDAELPYSVTSNLSYGCLERAR